MPDCPPEQRGRDTMVVTAHRMWNHRAESAEREGSAEDQFLHTDQNIRMETEPKPEPPKSAEETDIPQHTGMNNSCPKSECNSYWVKYPENGSKIKQHELWIKGCFGSNKALRPQKYHTGCK